MATQFNFEAIGTHWQIDIYEALSPEREKALLVVIHDRIDAFDKAYSRFRTDSIVTCMSKEGGTFTLPDDAAPMLSLYYDLYKVTRGLFTPLIGNLISDAGYDATYSLKKKNELSEVPTWEETMEWNDGQLTIKKPVLLDFGAAGKGYLVDLIANVLEQDNIHEYCVDAGGDILHKNTQTIRVGLEDPENLGQVVGVCELGNGSICGSAGNRRKWENFNHIMNPITRASSEGILAVWVTAETAMLADALATCLFFVPASALYEHKFEYVLIHADRSVERSAHFAGELFSV